MRQRLFFSVGLFLIGAVNYANAYIPPSQFLVKTWAQKHTGAASIRIRSLITLYDSGKPSQIKFKDTTFFQKEGRILKSWASDEQDKRLYTFEKSMSQSSLLGKALLSDDYRDLIVRFKQLGIPIRTDDELLKLRTESERRNLEDLFLIKRNGQYIWAISQDTHSDSEPQIWFEKDTFLPIRMIYESAHDGKRYDVRFENYRTVRGYPYPGLMTVTKKGEVLFTSELIDLAPDIELPSRLGKASSGGSFTELGDSASSTLQNLIRFYYDHAR